MEKFILHAYFQNAFEELSRMLFESKFIQGSVSGKPPKLSNAAVLQNSMFPLFCFVSGQPSAAFCMMAKLFKIGKWKSKFAKPSFGFENF